VEKGRGSSNSVRGVRKQSGESKAEESQCYNKRDRKMDRWGTKSTRVVDDFTEDRPGRMSR